MNLLIIGYGRHGKDTVADMLAERGLQACNSSWFACERVVYPALKALHGYKQPLQCYNDRHKHRVKWYDLITEYNTPDKTRLATELFAEHDIYVGMRNREELIACKGKGLIDLTIWVDASKRKPPETSVSCTVSATDADVIIPNNSTLTELAKRVNEFYVSHLQGVLK